METYRTNIENYDNRHYVVLCENKVSGNRQLVWNTGDTLDIEKNINFLQETWKMEKNWRVLQIVKLQNWRAVGYFQYWGKLKQVNKLTQEKFDFFKYVLGADKLDEQYRP